LVVGGGGEIPSRAQDKQGEGKFIQDSMLTLFDFWEITFSSMVETRASVPVASGLFAKTPRLGVCRRFIGLGGSAARADEDETENLELERLGSSV
jgi:hypothetical protein